MNPLKPVDHSAIRTNQASIISLLLLSFLFNAPLLAAVVMVFMLAGTLLRRPGFIWLYQFFLRPRHVVRPDIIMDNPEPHLFAQGMGGTVLLAAFVALLAGSSTLGWALVWLVIALAGLNLFAGFCAGCAIYYWLNRLHVPGFVKAPPDNTFPGLRPHGPAGQQEGRG